MRHLPLQFVAAPLPAAMAAAFALEAGAAAAAPLEAPLADQRALLRYEIEVTGASGGKPLRQRLIVETPVFAKQSEALNPLGLDFTAAQNEEIAAMSAATAGDRDGTAAMLEVNRLLGAMGEVCGAGESPACASARSRYQAAEQAIADHGAAVARAQAAVVRRDEDDQRFLTFAAGGPGVDCGSVRYEQQLGGRTVAATFPETPSAESGLLACMTMAVLDRRDGSLALQMSPATVLSQNGRIVDLRRLQGVGGLRFGAMYMSATLPPQPTAGPDRNYAGERTFKAGTLTYTFRWTLTRS